MGDIRYALRVLLRAPGFTAIALITLALGIGANTAIFSLVDATMLRALPVAHPGQLVLLTDPNSQGVDNGTDNNLRPLLAFSEYATLRDQNRVFSGLMAAESSASQQQVEWQGSGPEMVREKLVSLNYFSVLGIEAAHGRFFDPNQAQRIGADPVAVLSYGYWTRQFGRDPGAIGRVLTTNGTAFTVIGIAPSGFMSENVGESPDVFFPIDMSNQIHPGSDWLHDPTGVTRIMWLQVMGRLKPGVTLAQAQANCGTVFQRAIQSQVNAAGDAQTRKQLLGQKLSLTAAADGASSVRGQFADPLIILLILVSLVLLLAIVNLAGMLLARAAARQKEIGIRLALGAGRRHLIRQLLSESLLLSIVGGTLGALLAPSAVRLLMSWVGGPESGLAMDLSPDWRVLAFVALLCIGSGVLFGLLPALRLSRLDLNATLQAQGRGTTAHGRHVFGALIQGGLPLGKLLVIGQVVLSVLLIAGAGLFVRSLVKMSEVPLGFKAQGVLQFFFDTGDAGYSFARAEAAINTLRDRIAAMPGVNGVTFSFNGVFDGSECGLPLSVEGYVPKSGQNRIGTRCDQIGAKFFSTLGIPVLLGRAIDEQDQSNGPKNVDINHTFAAKYFDGRSPIGQKLNDLYPDDRGAVYTIVGVVADSKHNGVGEPANPRMYMAAFNSFPSDVSPIDGTRFEVRLAAPEGAVLPAIRAVARQMDPALQIMGPQMIPDSVSASLRRPELLARLAGFFGALAVLMAAIGLYGVMAYGVTRRSSEIGVRMALGAEPGGVAAMILRETLLLLAIGLVAGVPASIALARVATHELNLFGITFYDPAAFAATALILTAVAAIAGWLPARRASRIDPLTALRLE